ncbi:hypothetical protein C5470_20880 [Photorhabdus stackebrandtii]|uniref:Uncharacterized protein n=2 Tax=Photorhabdus stackebrandtii TaxID=1123042 RepID=A0A7X5QQM0_9GAMM|nr:hypothetical protein [Photorhabdus stackebrandtii]
MSNTLKIEGHMAAITVDPEIEMFRGEFAGLNGGADFYAYSVDELKQSDFFRARMQPNAGGDVV